MARKKQELLPYTPEQILALDIATVTGYYNPKDGGGVWDFDITKAKNSLKQYASFRNTLIRYIKANDIKQVVAEDVNVRKFFNAMRKLSEFRGILLEVCESLCINPPIFVNVTSIKKSFTGDGKATKSKIIRVCKHKYGFEPIDDNHADAFAVYHYHIKHPKKRK